MLDSSNAKTRVLHAPMFMHADNGLTRAELLFQLLSTTANCGQIPSLLVVLLEILSGGFRCPVRHGVMFHNP